MGLEKAADMHQCFPYVCRCMQDTDGNDDVEIVHFISLSMRMFLNIEQSIFDKGIGDKFLSCFLEKVTRDICVNVLRLFSRQRRQDISRRGPEACSYF